MPRQLIVLGSGQGGLSAAIHARLAGWEVLVLEKQDRLGGKAQSHCEAGFRFDLGPSIVILTEIYRDVFQLAGRRMEDTLRFQRLPALTRLFFAGEDAVDLPGDADSCLEVIRGRAPKDAAHLRELLEKLDTVSAGIERTIFARPFDQPWQLANADLIRFASKFPVRLSYREMVNQWLTDPLLRALFYGFPSYGGQSYDAKSPGGLMIPYYMLRRGVWWPEGGISQIPTAFASLAKDLGVEFITEAEVESVERENGRLQAVITTGGVRHQADAFISNIDRQTFRQKFLGEPPKSPSFSYFTLHYGIAQSMPNLSHHNLIVPADFATGFEELYRERQFPTEPIVYVNHCAGTEPGFAPTGQTDLFAVVTTPALEPHLDWGQDYEQRVRSQLRRAGFDWGPEMEAVKITQTPATFADRDGNSGGSLYGPDEQFRLWGMFPSPNRDPDLKNLAYCGGSVQPGAGLPMVTLSGKFAVQALISSGNRPTGSA